MKIYKLPLLTLLPSAAATALYVGIGLRWQGVPSMALLFLVFVPTLFLFEVLVLLAAGRREFGAYGLRAALDGCEVLAWWRVLLWALLLFAFAGLMTVTAAPLEARWTAGVSARLAPPAYFDWNDLSSLGRYSRGVRVFTAVLYLSMNVLVCPAVEELYFRGYLTRRLARYGWGAPVLATLAFSLYHWWLPWSNVFRLCAFLPAALAAWRKKNLYISMLFHSLCNLVSSIGFAQALLQF